MDVVGGGHVLVRVVVVDRIWASPRARHYKCAFQVALRGALDEPQPRSELRPVVLAKLQPQHGPVELRPLVEPNGISKLGPHHEQANSGSGHPQRAAWDVPEQVLLPVQCCNC